MPASPAQVSHLDRYPGMTHTCPLASPSKASSQLPHLPAVALTGPMEVTQISPLNTALEHDSKFAL